MLCDLPNKETCNKPRNRCEENIQAVFVITSYSIHYTKLYEVGSQLTAGQSFGTIESVKAVSDLNAPVAGEIVEVNHHVEEHLEYLSRDPWATWMIRIKPVSKNLDGLMDAEAYEKSISQAH